jgi:hypothetical protein
MMDIVCVFGSRRKAPFVPLNAVVNARLRAPNLQAALSKFGLDARMLSPQEFGAVLADENAPLASGCAGDRREAGVTSSQNGRARRRL